MIRQLGKVLHISPSKLLIVKIIDPRNIPPLGVLVTMSKRGKVIGRLIDIIGPVTNPYGVIKLIDKDLEIESGIEIFYLTPKPRRRKIIRRRRK